MGSIFVVSAPAGAGKTTLVNRLKSEFSDLVESVSCTTRRPRMGEVHGRDYYYVTRSEFHQMKQQGHFIETVELFGHYYGTLYSELKRLRTLDKSAILVLDVEGALSLRAQFDVYLIFIAPPSLEHLERRLALRGTESDSERKTRIARAEHELSKASLYDFCLINDQLSSAYESLKGYVTGLM